MRQTPIVSGVALLSLALGIGANVAIFSLVNALMLKPLPVDEPDRVVIVGLDAPNVVTTSLTNPQWEYIRDHQEMLVGTAAYGNPRFNLNSGGETRNVQGLFVSGRFFDTLGVAAHIGRTFTADDDRRGGGPDGPAAVLSYGFWQREYGGSSDVIGKPIVLDGHPFTIIGVSQRDFRGVQIGRAFDVAAPIGTEPIVRGAESSLDRRSNWWLTVIGRLSPGVAHVAGHGFESSRVLVGSLDLRRTGVAPEDRLQMFTRVREALAAVPGIDAAATSFVTPVSGSTWNLAIRVPGYDANERRGVLFNGV